MAYPATNLYPQTSGLYPGDGVEVLPEAVTGNASGIDTDSASVAGTVDPNGLSTHYYFEYSLAPRYDGVGLDPPIFSGSQSTEQSAGSGSSPVAVSATLSGLASGRTYYYTLVAFNGVGYAYGDEESFDTLVDDLLEFLPEFVHTADRGQ